MLLYSGGVSMGFRFLMRRLVGRTQIANILHNRSTSLSQERHTARRYLAQHQALYGVCIISVAVPR